MEVHETLSGERIVRAGLPQAPKQRAVAQFVCVMGGTAHHGVEESALLPVHEC